MSLRHLSVKFLVSLMLVAAFAAGTFADTLRLKDGSIIKGRIVSFENGKFVIAIGDGARRREMSFYASEVQSILFDSPVAPPAVNNNADYKRPVPAQTQTNPSTQPVSRAPVTQPANRPQSNSPMQPIQWSVNVLADNTSNGWTNTGWVVKKGQRIENHGQRQGFARQRPVCRGIRDDELRRSEQAPQEHRDGCTHRGHRRR